MQLERRNLKDNMTEKVVDSFSLYKELYKELISPHGNNEMGGRLKVS